MRIVFGLIFMQARVAMMRTPMCTLTTQPLIGFYGFTNFVVRRQIYGDSACYLSLHLREASCKVSSRKAFRCLVWVSGSGGVVVLVG